MPASKQQMAVSANPQSLFLGNAGSTLGGRHAIAVDNLNNGAAWGGTLKVQWRARHPDAPWVDAPCTREKDGTTLAAGSTISNADNGQLFTIDSLGREVQLITVAVISANPVAIYVDGALG